MAIDKNMMMSGDHIGKVLVNYVGKNEFENCASIMGTKDDEPIPFVGSGSQLN